MVGQGPVRRWAIQAPHAAGEGAVVRYPASGPGRDSDATPEVLRRDPRTTGGGQPPDVQ